MRGGSGGCGVLLVSNMLDIGINAVFCIYLVTCYSIGVASDGGIN